MQVVKSLLIDFSLALHRARVMYCCHSHFINAIDQWHDLRQMVYSLTLECLYNSLYLKKNL